ncbi:MAG: hypothetical protein JO102_04630 [Elusimicrobia bacterium]|nr:hypothetical protein [Elusimicrobiota bacterium]
MTMRFRKAAAAVFLSVGVLARWAPANAAEIVDATAGCSRRCEVHGVKMKTVRVPIRYGSIPAGPSDEESARQAFFPNVRPESYPGGCEPHAAEKAVVYNCPRCDRARIEWLNKHRVPGEPALVDPNAEPQEVTFHEGRAERAAGRMLRAPNMTEAGKALADAEGLFDVAIAIAQSCGHDDAARRMEQRLRAIKQAYQSQME